MASDPMTEAQLRDAEARVTDEAFVNLLLADLGDALARLSRLRSSCVALGAPDYQPVKDLLAKAASRLDRKLRDPDVAPQHKELGKAGA